MNTSSACTISDVVYMMKENNMIPVLIAHCHCSALYTKYVLKEIHIRIYNIQRKQAQKITEQK
jgi:hypothetical protein